jgi:hypothetical protein
MPDANTKLLLHMNSDFSDSSDSGHTPTVNGATIDTGIKKFGAGSGKFVSASSQYVTFSDSVDWTMGNGDWTVEAWFRRAGAVAALEIIFGQIGVTGANIDASFFGGIQPSGAFWAGTNIGVVSHQLTGSTTGLNDGNQHHYAMVRSGINFLLFADGVLDASLADLGTSSINDSAFNFSIGRMGERVGNYYNGHVDEFRISKGVARWTSDFTPPTSEYNGAPPSGDISIFRRRIEGG